MNTSPSKKKTLKVILFISAVIFLLAIVGGYEFVKARVPQMSGELNLLHLSAPVEVARDRNGIPHITAQNNLDAFRALGFIMAQERLFQMEMSRRVAQGELAEVFGEKALASDKLFRNLGLKSESEKNFQKKLNDKTLDPEMLAESAAFYDGINQFIAKGSLPIEFAILGIKPRPFSLIDGQSFIGLMAFSFGAAIMNEPLLTKLVKCIGEELVEDLRNEKIPGNVTRVVQKNSKISSELVNVITSLERGFNLFEGSNGWLLSGKRSQSGLPIFANDPHISYSLPGVWFEAHIKTPTYETYGHFIPVVPFPVLSHNRERAWGLTMSLTDDMDIYQENIDPKNKTYLYIGENKPLIEHTEIIKVANSPDFKMNIFATHHGPVLDYAFNDTSAEKSLSLQWAFYRPDNDTISALFKMGRARSMGEFKEALANGKAPGLNILYADKSNIGHWLFGEVWQKRAGLKTDFILNGESGKDEIQKVLTFSEKPSVENPENGLIVSANSRPSTYPAHLRGDWQPDDRYKTIEQILSQKEKWSPEELMELQSLSVNFENKILLENLLNDLNFASEVEKASFQKYVDILKKWDFNSGVNDSAPTIYYSWVQFISARLLKDLTKDEQEILAKTPNGQIFFKRVVLDKDSLWWKKFDRAALFKDSFIESIQSLDKKWGNNPLDWHWGKVHTLEFVHPIGRVKPFNKIFNLGPFPVSGATQEINNQKFNSAKDFHVMAGPSTRIIIDYAHPERSWGILPIGNSRHLLSPFYDNQVQLFLKGEYREQWLDLAEENVRFKMVMKPQH
jgi:penicillin amidase